MFGPAIEQFKQFLVANNVLAIAAGIAFGQATLQLIRSFVGDIALPSLYASVMALLRLVRMGSIADADAGLRPANFATEIVTYVLIVLTAFLLISKVFRRMVYNDDVAVALNSPPPLSPPPLSPLPSAPAADALEGFVVASNVVRWM